jgi:hypothetical protein
VGVLKPNIRSDACVPADRSRYEILMAVVIAHQGGWDEILFVALPLGLFAFLLFIANRKAQAQLDEEDGQQETEDRER